MKYFHVFHLHGNIGLRMPYACSQKWCFFCFFVYTTQGSENLNLKLRGGEKSSAIVISAFLSPHYSSGKKI